MAPQKIKILIIEDNPADTRLFKEMLSEFNGNTYMLEDADRLSTGLKKILNDKFDIIMLDLNLPDSFGLESILKVVSVNGSIPIIVLTGTDDIELAAKSLNAGAQDYLVKGQFDYKSLERSIRYSIERKRIEDEKNQFKEKLLESANQWTSTFDAIEDAISVVNFDGEIIRVNRTMCKIFNMDFKELIGQSCRKIMGSSHPKETCPIELSKLSKRREVNVFEQNGKFFKCIVDPVLDKNNNIIRMIHILSDITQQKKAEDNIEFNYKRTKKIFEQTISALSYVVEVKDPYTAGHQKNVAEISSLIAIDLGLDSEKIEAVRLASLIHDIGKIAIPASILSKPGKILPAERSMIEMHPKVGYEILKEIDFSSPIAEIVLQHHEKINGSGYPNRLTNRDILLEARILVVSDVVEAMSSHRPYRPAHTLEETFYEIESNKEILYDSDVVDSCLKLFKSGKFNIPNLRKPRF
ncbi:MAG: HD domain-containing protein [Cyanobacteria bacterium]|nr:HD domain-containing protein [Cyanobacteriota bacterium]